MKQFNENWCGEDDCPHCQGHERGPPNSGDCPRIQDSVIDAVEELHSQAKDRKEHAMSGRGEDAWRYVEHFTEYALNEYE